MKKVVFVCSVALALLQTDGVTAKRIKLGKDLSKVHGDIQRGIGCFGPNGCCKPNEMICYDGSCCKPDTECCGLGDACCDRSHVCCGNYCCDACCTVGGQLDCCSKTDTKDCSSSTYAPCVSQFDARPCDVKETELLLINATCPNVATTKTLYRVLRPDENCYKGLMAKFPSGNESALSFVNCGSKPDFASQYISFTSTLEVAKAYAQGMNKVKIAKVEVNDDLLASCDVIDLTSIGERKQYLGDAESGKYAANNCVYLLTCTARLPCKEF